MAKRSLITTKKEDQYHVVDDLKLRMTLMALADKISEDKRDLIRRCYEDPHLASIYRGIRNLGMYQKGGASKVHRKILEFPNYDVYDFVDTVMNSLYGPEWLSDRRALNHELVKPWWTVNKL